MSAADKTFARRYFEVQKVLDDELGTEDTDGAGEGIVADVLLALDKRERRGAVKALRKHATQSDEEAARITRIEGRPTAPSQTWAQAAYFLRHEADRVESGEVTLP